MAAVAVFSYLHALTRPPKAPWKMQQFLVSCITVALSQPAPHLQCCIIVAREHCGSELGRFCWLLWDAALRLQVLSHALVAQCAQGLLKQTHVLSSVMEAEGRYNGRESFG